jgi:monofunctional biosynthetic peptidoglycan transglycosylase
MSRSFPPKSRNSPINTFIDLELALFAAVSAATLSARNAPFGPDAPGRALGFIVRNWSGSKKRRPSASRRALPIRAARAALQAIIVFHAFFILSTSLMSVLFKTVNPAATTLMLQRRVGNGWKVSAPRYLPLAKIPKSTRNMVVRVEDGSFFEHHGILLAAMKNAYQLNKRFGEPVYGGSTITMQTARTIFLVPEKSYLRKYLEVIIALEMEAILGKERILELYFNYAEWGKGVFGIEAASRHHYKAGVASLSRDQAIRLVTLLSSPIRYTPYSFGKNGILKSRYAYLDKRFGSGSSSDLPPPPTVLPADVGTAPPGDESSVISESAESESPDPVNRDPATPETGGNDDSGAVEANEASGSIEIATPAS